ncbi:DUF6518 family protein [Streptomyces anulatus]|uniref:Uncharacterized protein n=1 Tax=Streptomyces anulatus TaxID=1892 RepID=A0A7K3RDP0_STRAQ|nr:DUF6518 family protein [Streptomyces anulatus]NDZ61316.1 hypothetical protein [Streptomyces anulatus]NEC00318.1 hypothetical protein [Streptomyces anulatus]NED30370.1 hypothetical protein [Streptomyces anulatus]
MAPLTALRRDTPGTVLTATAVFGLLLGWSTYGLHGITPVLDRATNSTSTWIIWTAIAGALIRDRGIAVWSGALMMLTTCCGYYAASALGDTFGSGGLGTAAVWAVAGLAGGPLLGWAGWTVRRARGDLRAVAGAVIAMVVLGEGLWMGLGLRYWGEAAVFLTVGGLLAALLTVYLARTGARRYWLCAMLAPVGGLVFYLAEKSILNSLIGTA